MSRGNGNAAWSAADYSFVFSPHSNISCTGPIIPLQDVEKIIRESNNNLKKDLKHFTDGLKCYF